MEPIDLEIKQGETFERVFSWASGAMVFKAITGITKALPAVITAVAHGVPNGWPVWVQGVSGMWQINQDRAVDAPNEATVLSVDSISIPIDSQLFNTYESGGALAYYQPESLSGYTARMQIRDSVDASTILLELTTANSRIVLDDTAKTITLTISAADSADIDWTRGVYDLELVSGAGVVKRLAQGTVFVDREVTR